MADHAPATFLRGWATPRRLAILAAIAAVLATGCSTATSRTRASAGTPSTTPAPTPIATPAPRQFQALVQDYTNIPFTVSLYTSTTGRAQIVPDFPADTGRPQFAPNDRLSFTNSGSLYSQDLTGGARREELSLASPASIDAYDWSPDGALAYLASPVSGKSQLVIKPTNAPETTVALPAIVGPGETTVRFSRDGSYVLLVGFLAQSPVQVHRIDGTLVFAAPWDGSAAPMPTEATWGADGRLYFWDAGGVNIVDLATGVTRTLLPGVRWYNPTVSPDGRYIAFELRDEALPRLRLLDTATGTVVSDIEIPAAGYAQFVSPTVLWFHEETACPPLTTCIAGPPPSDALLSYDLATHTQAAVGLSGFVTDSRLTPAS